MSAEEPELLTAAKKIRRELDALGGLEREFEKKRVLSDFARILFGSEASDELGELDRRNFAKSLRKRK